MLGTFAFGDDTSGGTGAFLDVTQWPLPTHGVSRGQADSGTALSTAWIAATLGTAWDTANDRAGRSGFQMLKPVTTHAQQIARELPCQQSHRLDKVSKHSGVTHHGVQFSHQSQSRQAGLVDERPPERYAEWAF